MMKWPSKSTFKFLLSEYDNILFCMLHTAFIILISHDSREPFPMRPTACRVSSPMFLVLFFYPHTIYNRGAITWIHRQNKHSVNSSHSSLSSANGLAETPLLLRKPCYRQCSRVTIRKYHQLKANFIKIFVIFFGKTKKMLRTLFFHLSDAHSLWNRIELSKHPQHVKRRH